MKIHILSQFYKKFFAEGSNYRKDTLLSDMNKYIETGEFQDSSKEFNDFIFEYSSDLDDDRKFAMGLMSDFPRSKYKNVLEVASGNNPKVSNFLAINGYSVSAIDPLIRENSFKNLENLNLIKSNFFCDDIIGKGKGTDIKDYDCLVGIRSCKATEHIIRQSLNYDKPFNIMLCNCANDSIFGQNFINRDDWYSYLISISQEVKIVPENGYHYITNLDKVHSEFIKTIPVEYDFYD